MLSKVQLGGTEYTSDVILKEINWQKNMFSAKYNYL